MVAIRLGEVVDVPRHKRLKMAERGLHEAKASGVAYGYYYDDDDDDGVFKYQAACMQVMECIEHGGVPSVELYEKMDFHLLQLGDEHLLQEKANFVQLYLDPSQSPQLRKMVEMTLIKLSVRCCQASHPSRRHCGDPALSGMAARELVPCLKWHSISCTHWHTNHSTNPPPQSLVLNPSYSSRPNHGPIPPPPQPLPIPLMPPPPPQPPPLRGSHLIAFLSAVRPLNAGPHSNGARRTSPHAPLTLAASPAHVPPPASQKLISTPRHERAQLAQLRREALTSRLESHSAVPAEAGPTVQAGAAAKEVAKAVMAKPSPHNFKTGLLEAVTASGAVPAGPDAGSVWDPDAGHTLDLSGMMLEHRASAVTAACTMIRAGGVVELNLAENELNATDAKALGPGGTIAEPCIQLLSCTCPLNITLRARAISVFCGVARLHSRHCGCRSRSG